MEPGVLNIKELFRYLITEVMGSAITVGNIGVSSREWGMYTVYPGGHIQGGRGTCPPNF